MKVTYIDSKTTKRNEIDHGILIINKLSFEQIDTGEIYGFIYYTNCISSGIVNISISLNSSTNEKS